MLRMLTADQLAIVDEETALNEGISSFQLMQRAAKALAKAMEPHLNPAQEVLVICGKGNNGGDALLISEILNENGFTVRVIIYGDGALGSTDFELAKARLEKHNKIRINITDNPEDVEPSEQVIDGLFGCGLNRPLEGKHELLVHHVNQWRAKVLSIDVPSGCPVMPDFTVSEAIQATHTFSIQLPKLTFMLPEYGHYAGEWHLIDIGLHRGSIANQKTDYLYFQPELTGELYQKRKTFSYKNDYGHVALFAGSKGMTGAAVLAGKAALRSGCGLLTIYCPAFCEPIVQGSLPEAMTNSVSPDAKSKFENLDKYSALGIGPGLGNTKETKKLVIELLNQFDKIVVLDADGLNAIQGHDPKEIFTIARRNKLIVTPHAKEFDRIFGVHINTWERIKTARLLCRTYKIIVVLKGSYTAVIDESGKVSFNSSGNAAMAKGGSGDVLTGMITAMVGKSENALNSVKLAVYLHGVAGDLAAQNLHEESVIASDIVAQIPYALRKTSPV